MAGASSAVYQWNPAAVLLCLAYCRKVEATREEMAGAVVDLATLPPAEQVRMWHEACRQVGIKPHHVLNLKSPGEGADCMGCRHLASVTDHMPGDRRRFRWACGQGYLQLEYGRHTERILLAPPECESWERWYPSDQR